jgi:hypothetical protein
MGGLVLWLMIIPGLIGLAVWERRGRPLPRIPDIELPVHGAPALFYGVVIALVALAIIAIDLAVISSTAR